ncbi:twin-arginine translocase subunit TatC [Nocardioides marmoriginsengisoli]|uniref:Sec-independent protein translocase protein TatC n=1 Tax=Nocardioides marmoriginsengisoli TaxID=661483 RepID=A0A3N0CQM4_9ACTN|nr:twin-arginine translocase subunit TatC [Nocardioides marmoriginsengisoli]RNL65758.1 twin-arginine translocase subunit TatC [Nocardioides marmoriginsengisoli]
MALADHFRELRGRLMRSLAVFLVLLIVSFFFYDRLLDLVMNPYNDARKALGADVQTKAYIKGATGPLMLNLKLCSMAALVVSAPFWLYQIWAFILPGLHSNEKRWTRVFVAIAGPLFLGGVGVGYYVLPKGLEVLIGFTPSGLDNLVEFGEYFSFLTRMLLVFGIAFEIPLFVVLLNLAGVVKGSTLGQHRSWIIVGTFIFAAVATPSTDPISMLFLAVPMTGLFIFSEVIARTIDRRRGRSAAEAALDDDTASPL